MPISVTVPDDVVAALKLPPQSVESDLRKELAVHLVAEGLLPVASACHLAGWSRLAFERLLGERKIPAEYTTDDLDQDVQTFFVGMIAVCNTSPITSGTCLAVPASAKLLRSHWRPRSTTRG
jgi:predicted HTH domain antitoxin